MGSMTRHHSHLEKLPLEIIHLISSFLPLSALVCLTLCSHGFREIIGTTTWKSLSDPSYTLERLQFLKNIGKEDPDRIPCKDCLILHPTENPAPQLKRNPKIPTSNRCIWKQGAICDLAPNYSLDYRHLRAVINRHLRGAPFGKPIETVTRAASTTPEYHTTYGVLETRTTKIRVSAVISENELLIRWQQDNSMLSERGFALQLVSFPQICPHLDSRMDINRSAKLYNCRYCHLTESGACPSCGGLQYCQFCETDYRIEFRKNKSGKINLIVTCWKNLGSGRSPYDPKWRTQVDPPWNGDVRLPDLHKKGSTFEKFERLAKEPYILPKVQAREPALPKASEWYLHV
ncbi:hypothetical protein MMC25_001715 [Agyrium rufum]|nr:hypothetical protein [Agyrium rufum]